MTTRTERVKNNGAEVVGTQKPGAEARIGNGVTESEGYAEERKGPARQDVIQVAERTELVHDTPHHTAIEVGRSRGASAAGTHGFDAFEADFRGHHYTNAARRRGPYEHYRLVYRYGYDLGADRRYCSAAWSTVEQDARPRWEERNPGTWEQFKDTIRYAWDKTREAR